MTESDSRLDSRVSRAKRSLTETQARIKPLGGELSSKSTGMCGHKMEGYGSFLGLYKEWDGVHLYGYVFTGISTGMGRIFGFLPPSFLKQRDYLKPTSILSNVIENNTSN